MQTLNLHEVQAHLAHLNDLGEPFIIAKAGKPMAQVVPYLAPQKKMKRIGFLNQAIHYSDDFDDSDNHEITQLFSGNHDEILA